jgi:zinc transport system permease protein
MPEGWLIDLFFAIDDATGVPAFVLKGVVAVVLVCSVCGMVGSQVVGNRMAFFSDAMAHCAFAGVALGVLSVVMAGHGKDEDMLAAAVPLAMVAFGAAVGAGIVYVREQTSLASDTVIGVFFALAIGIAAMLSRVLAEVSTFSIESFIFGNQIFFPYSNLVYLLALAACTAGVLAWRYNQFVFASFNPSLARTRRVSISLNNYLFMLLLALVVNLSIQAVGALLINALLVVPAATAANLSRNLRQMFWLTVSICVASGLAGFLLSMEVPVLIQGQPVKFGPSGTIVVVTVALFFLSMAWARFRRRQPSPAPL